MSANTLVATLLAMAGQRNIITVPRAFVQFTGSIESAMMLNQLLYWKPRAHGEAIYKTDLDWADELCLSRYAVRKARERLSDMGFLTCKTHYVKGGRAVHYQIDYEVLTVCWELWLQESGVKFENELYSEHSKVRKRTLLHEQSSKTNLAKFENELSTIYAENTSKIDDDGDGRTLAFLIDQGIGAAREFAQLPYEPMRLDFTNRTAAGQSVAIIVKAWRRNPPTEAYHYEQQPRSVQSSAAPDRPARRAKGNNSQFGSGESDRKDPGWRERLIAQAERGELP